MLGRSVGISDDELQAITDWHNHEVFDQRDRVVLQFTDSLARDNKLSDELYAELEQHFNEAEIMKLCITVSFAGLVNRVHATFKTEVDRETLDAVSDAPFCLLHSKQA